MVSHPVRHYDVIGVLFVLCSLPSEIYKGSNDDSLIILFYFFGGGGL